MLLRTEEQNEQHWNIGGRDEYTGWIWGRMIGWWINDNVCLIVLIYDSFWEKKSLYQVLAFKNKDQW